MKTIYLVRHGQTDGNLNRIMQGQLDIPLNETGIAQAEETSKILKSITDAKLVVSSDLKRASQTASIITGECGVPLELDPRLREMNLGKWQGKPFDEGSPEARIWHDAPAQWKIEGSETFRELIDRVSASVTEWMEEDDPVIFVSHGMTIAAFRVYARNLPIKCVHLYKGLANLEVLRMTFESDGLKFIDEKKLCTEEEAENCIPR